MNNSTNTSSSRQIENTVKACVYLVDFLICSTFTIMIMQTVLKESVLKKEVRFFILCHHLWCLTLFFGFGTVFTGIRAFMFNVPVLACWIIFAVQITIGRGLLMTLVLMALNTCIAVCWPLRYLAFVHSMKLKVIVCIWLIALLDPVVSVIYESIVNSQKFILSLDPTCPSSMTSLASRIVGIIFIIIVVSIILVSYILLFREGKRSGHFNSSNYHARRTIIIHGVQIALHIVPTFVTISIGGKLNYIILDLTSFIIFSFAQCFSPFVYGLRCPELRNRLILRQHCCAKSCLN
ncbi:odorant receptor 131-2-like [Pelodytes ibericus]